MRVVIVGAGFGGVAAAVELLRHGFTEVTLLEAASDLGGTWHFNTYPGAACDVPSHLYSYSYAQQAEWSRFCSPQAEILAYLRGVADTYDVARRIVFGTHVTACRWNHAGWTIDTADGPQYTADALVLAVGQLNQPAYPRIDGLDSFAGRAFHSARWEHDYDLRGKRVAVIGSGASAVQFVPTVADQAAHLTVFQRTGNWFLPRRNHAYPPMMTKVFQRLPVARRAWRRLLFHYTQALTFGIRHPRTYGRVGWLWSTVFMRTQLRNPELRRQVWPRYRFGCKRILFSSDWFRTLQRPDVDLVTDRIEAMTPTGPRTADGRVHAVDCVIYGTGFRATEFMFPMEVVGRDGRRLADAWAGGAHARLGISAPGFPSLFVLYGPNTNTSGGSIIHYLEAQAGYLRRALQLVRSREAAALDIRPDVERRADHEVQAAFAGTAWLECDSWYRNEFGRVVTNWPGYMGDYAARAADVRPGDFEFLTG